MPSVYEINLIINQGKFTQATRDFEAKLLCEKVKKLKQLWSKIAINREAAI